MAENRILLVEDDIIAQRIEKDILEHFKFVVDVVDNGQDAITLAEKNQYTYIFIDISLPDMDGFTLAETLQLDPIKTNTPLIALSVHADPLHKQCARDSGMTQFIRKPLTAGICEKLFSTATQST